MDTIFFEKQEAQLCAQHALNMLLQGDYFSADTLAEIAHRLDSEENNVLDAESRSKESQNMNDSGFFSVQVISAALETFQLELIPFGHPSVADIKQDPLKANAFICNRSEHWFVIRKFGCQWFELNSCKTGPELHTDTYISLFLTQLATEGYTILVVCGFLPESDADRVISANPVIFVPRPSATNNKTRTEEKKKEIAFSGKGQKLGGEEEEDEDMERAIRMSLEAAGSSTGKDETDMKRAIAASSKEDEDADLQEALRLSMQDTGSPAKKGRTSDSEDARKKRETFLKRFE